MLLGTCCWVLVASEVSAEAFFGFTDGTTVWAASISDRGMEPFMADYKAPLDSASGSVLNPFGPFVSAVQAAETFTVCFCACICICVCVCV